MGDGPTCQSLGGSRSSPLAIRMETKIAWRAWRSAPVTFQPIEDFNWLTASRDGDALSSYDSRFISSVEYFIVAEAFLEGSEQHMEAFLDSDGSIRRCGLAGPRYIIGNHWIPSFAKSGNAYCAAAIVSFASQMTNTAFPRTAVPLFLILWMFLKNPSSTATKNGDD